MKLAECENNSTSTAYIVSLDPWFLTGEDLPPNDKAISGDSFGFHNLGQGELLLAANG